MVQLGGSLAGNDSSLDSSTNASSRSAALRDGDSDFGFDVGSDMFGLQPHPRKLVMPTGADSGRQPGFWVKPRAQEAPYDNQRCIHRRDGGGAVQRVGPAR